MQVDFKCIPQKTYYFYILHIRKLTIHNFYFLNLENFIVFFKLSCRPFKNKLQLKQIPIFIKD